MLKAGSVKCKPACEVWPRPVKAAMSSQSREGDDADDYQQVPSYESSLSDAIQMALDNYDQTTGMHSTVQYPTS